MKNKKASPFGIVLTPAHDLTSASPFSAWEYQPEYFEPPKAFLIGDNSEILEEPLCIYAPFISPYKKTDETERLSAITDVQVSVPLRELSKTLGLLHAVDRLHIIQGNEHSVTLGLDEGQRQIYYDLRLVLPLLINW